MRIAGAEPRAVMPQKKCYRCVVAIVVPRRESAEKLSTEELIGYCRKRLASYKKPSAVHLVNELPRSDLGKVRKDVLREQFSAR
ncbi:MAG: hypothetical protein EPO21_09350 [Chloroflexota bacterium]|nr:MAG: hypothetical protein EPO21_09350 [Chloroflexota bacterium]